MKKTFIALLHTLALLLVIPQAAAAAAGEVLLITGQGTATDPASGTVRALAKGDGVQAGEIISSGTNSYVNLKFTDGSFILLRPNTRFVIEAYALDAKTAAAVAATPPAASAAPAKPATATTPPRPAVAAAPSLPAAATQPSDTSRAFFRLLRGGFRAVSGVIGKVNQNEYRISTPVATIGIRGTDYVVVICDAACARDPVLQEELPEGTAMEGGVVANVVDGAINVNAEAAATASAPVVASSPFGWLGFGVLGLAAEPETESSEAEVKAGHTAAVTRKRRIFVIDKVPRFLIKQPIPDPTTICQ